MNHKGRRVPVLLAVGFIILGILLIGFRVFIVSAQVKFACTLFDQKDNRAVIEGTMSRQQFQKWYRSHYPVAGERVETPKDATAFGALVLTDGDEILVMLLYTWKYNKQDYFACQSHEFGEPPMFSVLEESKKSFLEKMKKELGKLEKPE